MFVETLDKSKNILFSTAQITGTFTLRTAKLTEADNMSTKVFRQQMNQSFKIIYLYLLVARQRHDSKFLRRNRCWFAAKQKIEKNNNVEII